MLSRRASVVWIWIVTLALAGGGGVRSLAMQRGVVLQTDVCSTAGVVSVISAGISGPADDGRNDASRHDHCPFCRQDADEAILSPSASLSRSFAFFFIELRTVQGVSVLVRQMYVPWGARAPPV